MRILFFYILYSFVLPSIEYAIIYDNILIDEAMSIANLYNNHQFFRWFSRSMIFFFHFPSNSPNKIDFDFGFFYFCKFFSLIPSSLFSLVKIFLTVFLANFDISLSRLRTPDSLV